MESVDTITTVSAWQVGAYLVRSITHIFTFVYVDATLATASFFVPSFAAALKASNSVLAHGAVAVIVASRTLVNIGLTGVALETWTIVLGIFVIFADTGSLLPTLDTFSGTGSVARVQRALVCSDGPFSFSRLFIFRVDLSHLLSITNLLITLSLEIIL